ncbi:MAG: hypothetical protein N5P05_003897 [Chroococcopsis gigantea SAG 12.99]|jgi:transglutaminase-like putative cysteine protease|nr:DUF3488 domain-containing protein [Chlorogloea purpurea SAG 13.99]MDV3002291.1 hypothetical protein [Chroococcopsis gigantea SAG 12.99]
MVTTADQQPRKNKFLEKLQNYTPAPTEDSILLRALVQSLVIVGIIATDIATGSQNSLWAIPLSIIGSWWSWRQRKKRNIPTKFALAIGMLTVLAVFLSNIVVNLQDSRIALAGLLIQLQVLHSFDLPRRKDLGYSMVIGLILIGVAGTISETVTFAIPLLIFLLLALPTLVLDYRSRLGLERLDRKILTRTPERIQLQNASLSPKKLGIVFLTTLLLGLVLFAIMPRFASYQIQTFPVTVPEGLENKGFDGESRGIVNPGYASPGQGGAGQAGDNTKAEGPGSVDQTYYYGFNTKMNQNLRGNMKPEVLMRVRSQAPGFWRVLGFDRYTGQGWEISQPKQLYDIRRAPWSYRFFVPLPYSKARTREVIQSYSIVSQLPNLIPSLASPQFLFFPTKEVSLDTEGGMRSPTGLVEGLTYTVISQVPYRDRTELRGSPEQYSPRVRELYLQVPPEIAPKLREAAEQLLAQSPKPLTSNYEKALFLGQALKQNYQIRSDLPFFAPDEDLVSAFLFKYKGGYPDHFSTVHAMLLRSIGIPARVATGFAPGQFNPLTGFYIVKNTDAYAITEVFFPNYGWFTFDAIPGHELIPPSFEEADTFGVLKQLWKWVAGWLPSPITAFLGFLWENIIGFFFGLLSKLWQFISASLLGGLIGLIVGTVCGFLGWLAWCYLSAIIHRRRLRKLPPMEGLYQQLLGVLKERGYAKHPAQTPWEYATAARQIHPQPLADIIEEISTAYVGWRYGEKSPDLKALRLKLGDFISGIKKTKPR